jgi:hypothetical protein
MTEAWKPVCGYEGLYEISSIGRVKSVRWNRILKPNLSGSYPSISFCVNMRKKDYSIHVLVCTAFNGPKPTEKHEVNHIDGNKQNNLFSNLEWITKTQQHQHRFKVLGQQGPMTGKKHKQETKAALAAAVLHRARSKDGCFR